MIHRPVPTDVVVEVPLAVVEPLVDDDLLHPEFLLGGRVALVQGVLPQHDGVASAFLAGPEIKRHIQRSSLLPPQVTARPARPLPVGEAVGGG